MAGLYAHEFRWDFPDAGHVVVTGTFDDWSSSVTLERDEAGHFKITKGLAPHTKILYKYVVDGHWTFNPSQPCETDHSGNVNNVLETGDGAPEHKHEAELPGAGVGAGLGAGALGAAAVVHHNQVPGEAPADPAPTPAISSAGQAAIPTVPSHEQVTDALSESSTKPTLLPLVPETTSGVHPAALDNEPTTTANNFVPVVPEPPHTDKGLFDDGKAGAPLDQMVGAPAAAPKVEHSSALANGVVGAETAASGFTQATPTGVNRKQSDGLAPALGYYPNEYSPTKSGQSVAPQTETAPAEKPSIVEKAIDAVKGKSSETKSADKATVAPVAASSTAAPRVNGTTDATAKIPTPKASPDLNKKDPLVTPTKPVAAKKDSLTTKTAKDITTKAEADAKAAVNGEKAADKSAKYGSIGKSAPSATVTPSTPTKSDPASTNTTPTKGYITAPTTPATTDRKRKSSFFQKIKNSLSSSHKRESTV